MPQIAVSLWQDVIDDGVAEQLIAGITDVVASAIGEHSRASTTVVVTGVPRSQWGIGGVPSSTLFPPDGQ